MWLYRHNTSKGEKTLVYIHIWQGQSMFETLFGALANLL